MTLLIASAITLIVLLMLSFLIDRIIKRWGIHRSNKSTHPVSQPDPKKAIVIAGSYYQFYQWCFENGLNRDDYVYATEHSIEGHHLPIIRVGTWWEQSEELLRLVQAYEAK